MWRKIVSVILVIGGLSVISYPAVHDQYVKYRQKQLIEHWEEGLAYLEEQALPEAKTQPAPAAIDLSKEMEGLLIIDKINLRVPILTGVSERNLNLAVASIEGSGKPGKAGNYCIAGHRSRTRGVLFNRLDELTAGDKVVVETKDNTYTYIVRKNLIVSPEDADVLKNDPEKKLITLVTCDYRAKPSLRLIIQGELLPE
jgi:sortase A